MNLFSRGSRREEEVKNFYELCFEDFQRKTHNTITELAKENKKLKENCKHLQTPANTYKEVIEEAIVCIRKYRDGISGDLYLLSSEVDELLQILDKATESE